MTVRCVRVHDLVSGEVDPGDAYVVLVDRLWPRGVRKAALAHDEWCRDAAPSDTLRRDFHGGGISWEEFVDRYRGELADGPAAAALEHLRELARREDLVLAYAARDTEHNQARVLAELLAA